MASTDESGHDKNVASFEDLIRVCTDCGENYKPSSSLLKLSSLDHIQAIAQAALQAVKTYKVAYDDATSEREIAIAPLKPLATKIINVLTATKAASQTMSDVRSIIAKIQGRGRKTMAVKLLNAKALAEGTEPVRTASTSQESFERLVDHFAQLISILTAEPTCHPNESELKVENLNTLITDMKAKNTIAGDAWTALSNACITRDKLLYGELTGLVDVALEVKNYLMLVFGQDSSQFKHVSELQFARPQVKSSSPILYQNLLR